MEKISLFIDFKNIVSSEYRIDITKIPNTIYNYIKKEITKDSRITKKYVFIPSPCTDNQSKFADLMIKNDFDVISSPYMDKVIDVSITTKLIFDTLNNAFDIGVILSGNKSLYPAIKEVRNIGKQIIISNFSDKISSLYKDTNYETGPLKILHLDDFIDEIADTIISGKITPTSILKELDEFINIIGNIDMEKVEMKNFITYWAVRIRYLQMHSDTLTENDNEIIKKISHEINELSSKYKPGYIKSLNKKWNPKSWESEIKTIPKIW